MARETHTPLVDAHRRLLHAGEAPILGSEMLVDHVHPSIHGHQILAAALFETMRRMKLIDPAAGWESDRDRQYALRFQSLDDLYFLHGQSRLESLRNWSEGRAKLLPALERQSRTAGDRIPKSEP